MSPAEQLISLDAVADDGPELVATAALLAAELVQAFGSAEPLQLTREGQLRRWYWLQERWPALESWAASGGIDVIDDKLESPV